MPDTRLVDRLTLTIAGHRTKPGHPPVVPGPRDRELADTIVRDLEATGRLLPEPSRAPGE